LLLVLREGGAGDVESTYESWHKEHRSAIVPRPVAIITLKSLIEEEAFDGSLPSCSGFLSRNSWPFPEREE
jgi:hypothetical protein